MKSHAIDSALRLKSRATSELSTFVGEVVGRDDRSMALIARGEPLSISRTGTPSTPREEAASSSRDDARRNRLHRDRIDANWVQMHSDGHVKKTRLPQRSPRTHRSQRHRSHRETTHAVGEGRQLNGSPPLQWQGLAILLAACSPPAAARNVFPPALVTASPSAVPDDVAREVIERGRAYEDATGFFSSVISVQVRDLGRGQTFESRGGLAVHRPDAMRMQMSAAGGVTAIDLLARDGGYYLRLAGRDWTRGRLDETRSNGFPAASLARSFLGIDWSQARAVIATPAVAVVRAPTSEGYALVTLDRRDGTEREVRWLDAHDAERARVRFGEYDTDEHGVRWPRVVLFWQAEPAVTATITVETRTPQPTLPPATFQPPTS